METTGREQIKTETEGEIRGTKNGADFFDEPKKLVRVKRETEKDVVVEHCLVGLEWEQGSQGSTENQASIATLGGVHPRTVRNNEDGTMVVRPWLFYLLSEQNTNAIMELSVLLKTKGIPWLIASCQRTVATSRRTSKRSELMKPKYTLLFVFLSDYMNTLSLKLDPPSIRFTSIPSCRIHLRWRMTFFSSIRQMLVTVAPPQQQPRTRLPWRISAAIALNGAAKYQCQHTANTNKGCMATNDGTSGCELLVTMMGKVAHFLRKLKRIGYLFKISCWLLDMAIGLTSGSRH
ncbi:hypothetical protein JHK87_024901 [Glycine soja]|nr:hypothetical protein JHK87_024901 [Glycine soja]